ncbi:MAG TPA: redox-active disulfide protein 2 [Clostridiales bacterium]|nr:redox-active disulfide protein 2 [Clostridiales bacterium]
MVIKILGMGCAKCKMLEKITQAAVKDLGADATVEKVDDIQKIMGYGVMSTPALVVNEKVKVFGRVPDLKTIRKYIEEEM